MSFVSEYLTPFFKYYDSLLDGQYLSQQLAFKGGKEVGGDYVNKVNRANRRKITQKHEQAFAAVQNPTFLGFISDNIPRLLINPFDRLIAAFQAYPSLKARFANPGTFSHTFTEIMNQGLILGAYKGIIFNFAQLSLVLYPSVYLTNKSRSENQFFTFLSTYTLFDAILYPLDTLKNILYADTLGKYNIKTVANGPSFLSLYRGIFLKLGYNIPVLSGIYCTTQTDLQGQAFLSWLAAFALYPLNTLKVRSQVSSSSLSTITAQTSGVFHSAYRGVIPFLLINVLIGYSLRPLLSKSKLGLIEGEVKEQLKAEGLS